MVSTYNPQKSAFLFSDDSFEYYILGSDYRDETLVLTGRAFYTEPSSMAFSAFKPEMKVRLVDWLELIDLFMDDCSTNGLSVIAIEKKTRKVIAVLLVQDLALMPQETFRKYETSNVPLSPVMMQLIQLDDEAMKRYPDLKKAEKPGYGVDFWMLGVHPDFRGRNLAQKMFECALPLAKNKGYKIAVGETTGAFSANVFRNNYFKEVCKLNAKELIWNGEKVFQSIRKPHGEWRFWVKNLSDDPLFKSKL